MRVTLLALLLALAPGCSKHTPDNAAAHADAGHGPPLAILNDPPVGTAAPDGDLVGLDGAGHKLSERLGPVTVMLFGNFSCPGFRGSLDTFKPLAARYGPKASFLFLYTRESHPSGEGDGTELPLNKTQGVCLRQPKTIAERIENARQLVKQEDWDIQTLVVPVDDAIAHSYMTPGTPARLFIVEGGIIRYKSGPQVSVADCQDANAWLASRFPEVPPLNITIPPAGAIVGKLPPTAETPAATANDSRAPDRSLGP